MEKVTCGICGFEGHALEHHVKIVHGVSVAEYKKNNHGDMLSDWALLQIGARLNALENLPPMKLILDIEGLFGHKFPKVQIEGYSKPWASTPDVDPDYVFEKDLLRTVLFAMIEPSERMLLTGPTGSGKSSVVQQVVARLNRPFTRINCDGDLTRSDFVGQMVLNSTGGMEFQYGPLPQAMREGRVLLIDEWDAANPSVSMALQGVLEEGGRLTITENNEVIEPHPDFRIFATANTRGQGDDSGMYHGTQPQNYAALDRFTIVDIVNYPKAEVEREIITKKTGIEEEPKDRVLEKLVQMAGLVRAAFIKEEINCTMSTRTVINIARKLTAFGDVKLAYKIAFTNKCSADDTEVINALCQRVWG